MFTIKKTRKTRTYECPYLGCKTKAIPTKDEKAQDVSYFETRIISEGWMMGLTKISKYKWKYKLFCPECSEKHLI